MKNLYFFIGLLLLSNTNCKKEEVPKENESLNFIFGEDLTVDSVTKESVVIQFKLDKADISETGIIYSNDSTALILHSSGTSKSICNTKLTDRYSSKLINLKLDSRYWFQVYYKNSDNRVIYSKSVYSFKTASISVRWTGDFGLFKKVIKRGGFYIEGDLNDTVQSNYEATLGNKKLSFSVIPVYTNGAPSGYIFRFNIPRDVILGLNKFILKFKGTKVFEDELEVIKGSFYYVSTHPLMITLTNHFMFQNEIYMFNTNPLSFWKWNPINDLWTELPNPGFNIEIADANSGYEINNKVYFSPVTDNTFNYYGSADQEKYVLFYDPELKQIDKKILQDADISINPINYCSFVYNNKLYSFIREDLPGQESRIILKVFNPNDLTWKIALNSVPFNDACGCRSIVISNVVYLLTSHEEITPWWFTTFRNKLFKFNPDNLNFENKSIWDGNEMNGVQNPYMFEHSGHLNTYGGMTQGPVTDNFTDNSYEYDESGNTWSPYYDYFRYSIGAEDYAPRYGGFVYKINNRIYIGIGFDNRSTNIYNKIYEYYLD